MSNLAYRPFGATMKLVVLVFGVATGLLVLGYIDATSWVNVTVGGVFGWILRDGATKLSEAWANKDRPETKAQGEQP